MRVRVVGTPTQRKCLQTVIVDFFEECRPFDFLELNLNADVSRPHIGDCLQPCRRRTASSGARQNNARSRLWVRVLRHLNLLFGFLHVKLQTTEIRIESDEAGRKRAVCGFYAPIEYRFGDECFVYCVVERSSEVHIVKWLQLNVKADVVREKLGRDIYYVLRERFVRIVNAFVC